MINKTLIFALFLLSAVTGLCHDGLVFTENKGQWHENVEYRVQLKHGDIFYESTGITFSFIDKSPIAGFHPGRKDYELPEFLDGHAVKVEFLNANRPEIIPSEPIASYKNYYHGNNPSNWASHVQSYKKLTYKNIYDNIDFVVYQYANYIKYDFVVHPGGDPSDIKISYDGQASISLNQGDLIVETPIYDFKEKEPLSYQETDGRPSEVKSKYKLHRGTLSYDIIGDYDDTKDLIIDPVLVFSTYTGSTADNFGFTATYDDQGNAFGGGTVYEFTVASGTTPGQYPTSAGAFQVSFQGGNSDIGISKFNADGTQLLYSTYIGGDGVDAPHSLIADSQGNLYIMGSTSSTNFPTTPGAVQSTFGGGTQTSPTGSGLNYTIGSDIFVAKLNPGGTALLGATYLGGSANDGLNAVINQRYFYGDSFRGEIILDGSDNPILISTTRSNDFPVTAGAPLPVYQGGVTDAVVCKLSTNLNTLLWSTYWGGSADDNGLGVQLDLNGDIIITGGTGSADMLTSPTALNPNYLGGMNDGYVTKFSASGFSILGSTFVGTHRSDMSYLVQVDNNNDIYVLAVSDTTYPILNAAYSNPNSNQFIQKFDNDLTTSLMSTVVGSGTGVVDFSPTAFLINNCGNIYLSGWGGTLNSSALATQSSTNGLPTMNPTQGTTDGEDFYVMVLEEDAQSLIFATFFGANSTVSDEHVDGGTSRFTKEGVIYQAVCAGCGGTSDFPTTPGVWSTTNNSQNCNLAVFKYDIDDIVASANFTPNSPACQFPYEIIFDNTSTGAIQFIWDYGDGSDTTSVFEESHFYQNPGNYTVTLIAIDSSTCLISDTLYLDIFVPAPPVVDVSPADTVCALDSVFLSASGGETYVWSPSAYLDNPNSANPIATPPSDITYTVAVTDTNGCTVNESVEVSVWPDVTIDAGVSIVVDIGEQKYLNAVIPTSGVADFWWDPPTGLSCSDCTTPWANPPETTTYTLYVLDENGCLHTDTVTVFVTSSFFAPNAFTPNFDGVNDEFKVVAVGMNTLELYIFNRWGELIFYSEDADQGWDGTYNGVKSPSDVYVWMVKYTDTLQPEVIVKKYGHVTLIR